MERYFTILLMTVGCLIGCASNPNKPEALDTQMTHETVISGDQTLGIKHGEMVVQEKVLISEHLRDLQNQVYYLEDDVYGNEKTGRRGLYGVVRDCHAQASAKENGGDGKLPFMEPADRVSAHEEELHIGLDERDKLIGVSTEFLKARLERFQGYRKVLESRRDDLEQKRDVCQAQLRSQRFDLQAKE